MAKKANEQASHWWLMSLHDHKSQKCYVIYKVYPQQIIMDRTGVHNQNTDLW